MGMMRLPLNYQKLVPPAYFTINLFL